MNDRLPPTHKLLSLVTVSPSRSETDFPPSPLTFLLVLQQKCGSLETVSRRELPEQQLYTHIHTGEHHVAAHLLPPSPLKETLEWFATAFYGRFYARSKTSQSGRRLSSSQRRRQTTSARAHSGVVCERACEPSPVTHKKTKS